MGSIRYLLNSLFIFVAILTLSRKVKTADVLKGPGGEALNLYIDSRIPGYLYK